MCGRFTLTVEPGQLRETFSWLDIPDELTPRYNVAPTQPVAVVPNDGKNKLDFFVWGLIPSWTKDPQIGSRMINARAETLAEKPSFRAAYRRRRCLVLADGFYEWRKEPGGGPKTPMYIQMESREPFAFAGLWEIWYSKEGDKILSCNIITTEPNELIAKIHNRMPVILPPEEYTGWLDPEERQPEKLDYLLKPFPAQDLIAYPVARTVNSPKNESPECILPV